VKERAKLIAMSVLVRVILSVQNVMEMVICLVNTARMVEFLAQNVIDKK